MWSPHTPYSSNSTHSPECGMLVAAPQGRTADAVAGAPVVVPGAAMAVGPELELLTVGVDPPDWRPKPS